MARGALANSRATISIAITGIAGPGGDTPQKSLGTISFAVAYEDVAKSITKHFAGNREQIREQSVKFALELLLDILKKWTERY
jgi:nicotinamide-nucleotide amidase